MIKDFIDNITLGITELNSAILAFDISESSFYSWKSAESPLSAKEKLVFFKAIERGKAIRNQRLIAIIQKASQDGDGKLALDLLKRLERKEYGDEIKNKIASDGDEPFKVIIEDYGNTNHPPTKAKKSSKSD